MAYTVDVLCSRPPWRRIACLAVGQAGRQEGAGVLGSRFPACPPVFKLSKAWRDMPAKRYGLNPLPRTSSIVSFEETFVRHTSPIYSLFLVLPPLSLSLGPCVGGAETCGRVFSVLAPLGGFSRKTRNSFLRLPRAISGRRADFAPRRKYVCIRARRKNPRQFLRS